MRRGCALGLVVCTLAFGAPAEDAPPAERFDTVVIDAGHGGDNEGARGPDGVLEKDVVLAVARRLAAQLREQGLRVVLTRQQDRFVGLEERTAIANDAGGNLFVSIHCNADATRRARGVETFFLSLEASDESASELARRENQAFETGAPANADLGDPLLGILSDLIATEHLEESAEFARFAHAELAGEAAAARGVKQAPFVVLMGLRMPASLVEIGFLSNPAEGRALLDDGRQEEIARALARAVERFRVRHDARRGVTPDAREGAG